MSSQQVAMRFLQHGRNQSSGKVDDHPRSFLWSLNPLPGDVVLDEAAVDRLEDDILQALVGGQLTVDEVLLD